MKVVRSQFKVFWRGKRCIVLLLTQSRVIDKLIVKGIRYDGTSGPSGVAVAVNDVFTWSSDGS